MYSETDKAKVRHYGQGYKDGYEDMRRRVTVMLWDLEKNIEKLDPELADTLKIALDRIEKLK